MSPAATLTPPVSASVTPAQGTSGASASTTQKGSKPPQIVVPFVRAAHEHIEPMFDVTVTPGAGTQVIGPFDVPAYGFMRDLWLLVTASGGVLGPGVLSADYPWNIFNEILGFDVNSLQLSGPMNGFELYCVNLAGGYTWLPSINNFPDFVGTINAQFMVRVPMGEITGHDAYGSLPNENAQAAYRFRGTIETSTVLFSTAPTTIPSVRVRGFLEAWSRPPAADQLGNPQEREPRGAGTTQFWTKNTRAIVAGQNTNQITKVGNLIRNILLLGRNNNAGAPRDNTVLPDPITINWDNRQLSAVEPQIYRRSVMAERFGLNGGAGPQFPTGLLVYDFTHDNDGHPGWESRHLWLPTVQASRLEFNGVSATAGNLIIITNDVAPVRGR